MEAYGNSPEAGFSRQEHSHTQASSREQTNRIPLSNGKYQIVFMFSHFSKASYTSPMSVQAENTTIVDDLRSFVPSQAAKSFSLTREVYVTDGTLDLQYSSGTADVLLTMLLKKTGSAGNAPPPPPAAPPSGDLITLVSPEKTVYSTDEVISLKASIRANSGISRVAFTINTYRLPEQTPAANATQVSYNWKNMTAGTYKVRAEAVTSSGKKIVTEPYTLTVEAAQDPRPTGKGLQYTYYEGKWSSIPDFQSLQAKKSGTVSQFTLSPRERDDLYGFMFSGYISIEKSGTYTFYTSSDDGSRLYIDSKLLVNNDGLHGKRERSGEIYLSAGLHAIRVDFFENIGNETLTVSYAGLGIGKQEIPEHVLFTGKEEKEEAETPPPASAGNLPWLEDFNTPDGSYKGTIEDAIYKNAIFKSENGKLTARGVGKAAWKSEVIKLNGQTVDFSLVLSSVGNLENVDDVKVYYRLDQGAEVPAGEVQGGISGYKVISGEGLQGNNLQLVVRFRNSDISEHYFLDMVKVALSGEEQQAPPSPTVAEKYLINFGGAEAPAASGWNNFHTSPVAGKKAVLKNSNGNSTGVSLALESTWDDANDKGYSTGNNQGIFPDAVMQHYFYTKGEETIRISGLNSGQQYRFTFFGSSMYDSDRTTEYLVGSQKASLNASMNKNKTATLENIRPDAQGNVVLKVRKADKASFGFLNALLIETATTQNARQQIQAKKTEPQQQTAIAAMQAPKAGVSVYPNPARHVVYIETPEEVRYTLYDTQGRLLSSGTVAAFQPKAVSLQGLQHGIYHIRLDTGTTVISKKLFVQP